MLRSRKLFKTALLSVKKIGSGIFLVVAHAMASSKAAISASNEEPAGHQLKESCQADRWQTVKAYDPREDLVQ